jgi:hypothetical protein
MHQFVRRAVIAAVSVALFVPAIANAHDPSAPEPDGHQGHTHSHPPIPPGCAPASRGVPSGSDIQQNACRPMDAGDFIEPRLYQLRSVEGVTTPEATEVGNTTWLTNHCASTLTDTTREYYTVPSFGFEDNPSKSGDADLTEAQKDSYRTLIRQEIKAADRVIHQSGETGDAFHRRVTCSKDASGNWDKIAVRMFNLYTDNTGDGLVRCSDLGNYISMTSPYNNVKTRHMVYMHTSLAGAESGPSEGEYCNYAWGSSRVSNAPGQSNPANSRFDIAFSESWRTDGVSGYSVSTTNQELGHGASIVNGYACSSPTTCPPGAEPSNNWHTYDWPDFMNGGGGAYYYGEGYVPPAGYRPQTNCKTHAQATLGTSGDLWTGGYVDCGRDTYWNPNPAAGTWLCTHFNYATDSPYFNKRYVRSAICPAS